MSYEIPSIAFQRGALGEIIEDGKSGLLVSGPNAEEICDAILRILQNRDLAKRLSVAARKRVEENFSSEKMVDGMLRVYQEALHLNPTR
jgi:glycosyltransferase involved in cell wall biosynthesis